MSINDMTREERKEIEALSKEVFGSTSKWKKFIEKGYAELQTRTVVEQVPAADGAEATTKEIKIPVLAANGTQQFITKYHTLESALALMVQFKAQKDAYLAELKAKHEAEEQAKKAKEVHQQLSGSAV